MKKTIVCFANSRKIGEKCFAGKDIKDKQWIRPVSERDHEALNEHEECLRQNNCQCKICRPLLPKLLDVIEIDLDKHVGEGHQMENYLIKDTQWKKVGVLKKDRINRYLDKFESGLWINGYGTWYRKNDKIPINEIEGLRDSLRLFEVDNFRISVMYEGRDFGNLKKRVRGCFTLNNEEYIIPITDPTIELEYLEYPEGEYIYNKGKHTILSVSLGKDFNGFLYKFISGIILI